MGGGVLAVESPDQENADGFGIANVTWPQGWLDEDPELPERLMPERDRTIEVWRRTRLGE